MARRKRLDRHSTGVRRGGRRSRRGGALFPAAVLATALLLLIPVLAGRGRTVPDGEAQARVQAALPQGLDPARRSLVEAACSLVGRVDYFWGGKSEALGWDSRWGLTALVTAEGGQDTGKRLPFGLDCSGYVSWAAVNAVGDPAAGAAIGSGARGQWRRCRPVDAAEARPGDLAFFPDLSHVGIVAGREADGTLLVLHCSRTLGGVVLSPDGVSLGFTRFGAPDFYLIYGSVLP